MTWCPLPWTHLAVKNTGQLRVCSHANSSGLQSSLLHQNDKLIHVKDAPDNTVLNCDTLLDMRQKFMQGEWPEQCKRCKDEYAISGHSRNIWEERKYMRRGWTREQIMQDTDENGYISNPQILTMDLRMGNECNLRCSMCFPGESQKWFKDYQAILNEDTFNVDGVDYDLQTPGNVFTWDMDDPVFIEKLREVEYIKLGGGEPILMPRVQKLLERLIENGLASNITVEFSINLTILPSKTLRLFPYFYKIILCCSLDGIGEVAEAVRYPSKWHRIEKSLNEIDNMPDNVEAFTSATISMLSLEHFADTMLYVNSQKYKKINRNVKNFTAHHPVFHPQYLNPGLYDDDLYYKCIDAQIEHVKRYGVDNQDKIIADIEFYYNHKSKTTIYDPNYSKQQLCRAVRQFEIIQKQDWARTFPVLTEQINRFNNE